MHFLFLAALMDGSKSSSLPAGDGKEIVQHACGGCHAMKVVTSKRATPEQWATLVNQMVSRGADVDDDDIETVVKYLSKNFPAATRASEAQSVRHRRSVNVNLATAAELVSALKLSPNDAAAVVSYRKQNGKFKTLSDLAKVPGIELQKIEDSKDRLRFE